MSQRPKFKPEITRVRLNPEQAVLTCDCYNTSTVDVKGRLATPEGSVCIGTKSYNPSSTCSKATTGSS